MLDLIDLPALLAAHGTEVARADDTAYLALPAIYACANGSAPAFYCVVSDWQTTPAYRISELERVNTELMARVAALEAQIATPRDTPAQSQAAQFQAQTAYLHGAPPPDPVPCPDCQATFKNSRSLQMHRQRAHEGMQAGRPRTAVTIPLAEDHGWRCQEPSCTGAFTRSLSSPDYCTRHAAAHTNGNGVLA